jgi:5,10-methylenetetrahydromethanopterin reductase
MRIAVGFIPGMPPRRVVELAKRVEALGYDALFIPDQTFHRDPLVVLGLCAEATERIQLGLAVTNPYTRHPVQIARAAGLLGELAEGRFLLGLGAGNRPRVLHGFGLAQTGVIPRLRETITIVRRLLTGETIDYSSPTLTLNEVGLDYTPPYRVPIYIGTRGPKLLALAGELADGVFMEGLFTPGGLAWARAQVAEGAVRAGRDPADITTIAWQAIELLDNPSQREQDRFRRWAALLIRTTAPDVLREIGVSQHAIDSVAAEVAAGGGEPDGAAVGGEDIAKLLLVGTGDEFRSRLDSLVRGGVDMTAGVLLGDADQIAQTIERLARELPKDLRD